MPESDTYVQAFYDDLTEQSSRDRINLAKEHWRAYIQGITQLELLRNKQTILLSAWRAEDQLIFLSTAEPGVCVACGTQGLVKTYRTPMWAQGLCVRCFKRRVLTGETENGRSERDHDG
ncbi:MAG: hypothetical protein V3T61_09390 [Acidobacteriota bacterium]